MTHDERLLLLREQDFVRQRIREAVASSLEAKPSRNLRQANRRFEMMVGADSSEIRRSRTMPDDADRIRRSRE